MQIHTFIFDMDGVIIDSEPFWRQAQIENLKKHKVTITIADCIKNTMGKRIDDVALTWCNLYNLKITPKALEQEIITTVALLITEKGKAKKGLYELLDFLKTNNFKIGLATSSSLPIIKAVFNKLSIAHYFNVVCSADNEEYGKPHPAIYINTAKKLGAQPINCLVLEDSVTGLIAAKAASMKTFVIPEDPTNPKFTIADNIFSSMLPIITHIKQLQEIN